jgi:SRSO17 transposase
MPWWNVSVNRVASTCIHPTHTVVQHAPTGGSRTARSASTPFAGPRRMSRAGYLQTKPQLAQQMLARAMDAQVPAGWVTADEVYGGDARLRAWPEDRDLA